MANNNPKFRPVVTIKDFVPPQYKNMSPEKLKEAHPELYKFASKALESYNIAHSGYDLDGNLLERVTNLSFLSSGLGGYANQMQTFLTCLDRYQHNILPVNSEYSGLTFITRPRLCFQSANLRANRRMIPLDTKINTSMAWMIRCLLDTNLANANPEWKTLYNTSPLFDNLNPFMVPLVNAVTSISGLPDPMVQSGTTEGGYQCEDQSFVIGGDNLNRTYNLQIGFKDIQYGPIAALFYYWIEYMRCVTRGIMMAYADDIDQQRLNYTVSIYRFNLDPSKQYITKYCKCTGCFPTSVPFGAMLSKNAGEHFVNAATEFSIPFVVNKVEYQDYAILMDFNALMRRYCPGINWATDEHGKVAEANKPTAFWGNNAVQGANLKYPALPPTPLENFRGLPYVSTDRNGIRLEWRRVPNPVFTQSFDLIDQLGALDYAMQVGESSNASNTSSDSANVGAFYNRRMAEWMKNNKAEVNFSMFNNFDKVTVLRYILNHTQSGGHDLKPLSAEQLQQEVGRMSVRDNPAHFTPTNN